MGLNYWCRLTLVRNLRGSPERARSSPQSNVASGNESESPCLWSGSKMNVKSGGRRNFREADNMFNLKKRIAMGSRPMIDRSQRALLCARLIGRHHEDVAVKLRKLSRVVSAEIRKKELLHSGK